MFGSKFTSVAVAALSFAASVAADVDPIVIQVGFFKRRNHTS